MVATRFEVVPDLRVAMIVFPCKIAAKGGVPGS